MAVDIDRHSGLGDVGLAAAQWQLSALLAAMCDFPEFDGLQLFRQSSGDDEIVLLPAGIDEPRTVTLVMNRLVRELREVNNTGDQPRIRLCVVVHEGITMLANGVFDGPAVREARRLLGVPPLRMALVRQPTASLAALFSDRVYADLGGFDHCLRPEDFTPVPIGHMPETGWLLIPEVII